MRIQFLHDGSEVRSYGGGSFSKSKDQGGLFWWTILIFLLLALATVSWFFSIMVFSYPEKPFNYRLLTKLEKLEPIKKFDSNHIPHGKFLSPTKLLEEYSFFTPDRLRVTNDTLKRDYIRNFKEHPPVYVRGSFVVLATRPLTATDVFTDGWVVVGRSSEIEDVNIELILPGTKEQPCNAGDVITLDNKKAFAATMHVQKLEHDRLSVTVVPLLYDEVAVANKAVISNLIAPQKLNMDATWPIWRDVKYDEVADVEAKAVQVTAATVSNP